MKNYKSFVIAILGIVSMVSICQAVPVEWVRQSDSPVLDTGGPSPYESYGVGFPSVLIQDGIYKMWYWGYRAGPSPRGGICYATSEDKGLTWTKHGTVLEVTEEWERNSPPRAYNQVGHPTVVYEEGMYKMWYKATGSSLGYTTSVDGVNWGVKTQQLGHGYVHANVVKGPSDYKLYYYKSGAIYVMESSDGGVSDPWEIASGGNPILTPGGAGQWDDLDVGAANVRYEPETGKFQMWYAGASTTGATCIGFALSGDGLTWEKYINNPVLEPVPGTWESNTVIPGSVVFDSSDSMYRMFYGGYHHDHWAIGLATAVSEPACWVEQDKLLASDGAAGDEFGRMVSLDGIYAIIGAVYDDSKTGSAYIFKQSENPSDPNWYQQLKLIASDAEVGDWFGWSVSIRGNYAAVGAISDNSLAGSAYIFERSEIPSDPNWYEQCKLTASDDTVGDQFGYGISVSGDYMIVTAPYSDAKGSDSGSAYIFKREGENWTQQAKLLASDGAAGDSFGYGVSMSGDYVIIGAYGHNNVGAAYIFKKSDNPNDPNWYQQRKLTASDGDTVNRFGDYVSIYGSYAIVGASQDSSRTGSAYVFKREGENWIEQAKLTASDGMAGDLFGYGISINEEYAIVGAPSYNGIAGAVYVFEREAENWVERQKIIASDTASQDRFGAWISMSGNYAIISGHGNSDNGAFTGSAYVFENTCQPANIAPIADAGPTQTPHIGTLINLDGSASSDPDENYPLAYSWQMVSKPQGSEAELFDSDLVNPSFMPDVNGIYIIELVVTDSLDLESQPDSVVIDTYNTYPVAEAADDQAVIEMGSLIQLDGSQSYDDDGDGITYLWTIAQKPVGSLAVLSDPCAVDPNFIADVHGDYIVTLVVTDAFGAVSQPDSMTVSFDNIKPVADAGGNQAVVEGDIVFLDGSDSNDVNGDELSYKWNIVSKPSGSNTALSDSNAVDPSFIADVNGSYVISLIVNDGFEDSNPANVTVMAISNEDAATGELMDAVNTINSFDPAVFKNKNLGGALTNKINAALELIDQGYYIDALDKLQNDILKKTNGCAESEARAPDKNDWIKTCEEQEELYPFIVKAIQYLEEAIQ